MKQSVTLPSELPGPESFGVTVLAQSASSLPACVAGEVTAVGAYIENIHVGDRVVTAPPGSCGACTPCLGGDDCYCLTRSTNGLALDLTRNSEGLINIPVGSVVKFPPNITYEDAAIAAGPALVGQQALRRARNALVPGAIVLVVGDSPSSRLAAFMAHSMGCQVLLLVDDSNTLHPRIGELAHQVFLSSTDAGEIASSIQDEGGVRCVLDFEASALSTAVANASAAKGCVIVLGAESNLSCVNVAIGQIAYNASARRIQGGSRGDLIELLALLRIRNIPWQERSARK